MREWSRAARLETEFVPEDEPYADPPEVAGETGQAGRQAPSPAITSTWSFGA